MGRRQPPSQRIQEAWRGRLSPAPAVGKGDDRLVMPLVGEGGKDGGQSIRRLVEVEDLPVRQVGRRPEAGRASAPARHQGLSYQQ